MALQAVGPVSQEPWQLVFIIIIYRLKIKITLLYFRVLSSLNLPAAIEDLSGTRVPASVLEKAAKIREMGGVSYINKLMSELPELLQRNRELLDEVRSI